jgi:hypothetical protein
MPYDSEALKTNEFYQNLVRKDEKKYVDLIRKKLLDGDINTGTLRDADTGNILLFETVVPGEGSNGLSFNPSRLSKNMDRQYLSKAKPSGKKKKSGKKIKKGKKFSKEIKEKNEIPVQSTGRLHTLVKPWGVGYFDYDTSDEKIIDKEFTEL